MPKPGLSELRAQEGRLVSMPETQGFVFNQTMLRIRDPQRSLDFYSNVLGMTLVKEFSFPDMRFSLYFVGYVTPEDEAIPGDAVERSAYAFRQKAMLELTHNWGTESDDSFAGYHNGNDDPRGYGHIGLSVPDVESACERFEKMGVEFCKTAERREDEGAGFHKGSGRLLDRNTGSQQLCLHGCSNDGGPPGGRLVRDYAPGVEDALWIERRS